MFWNAPVEQIGEAFAAPMIGESEALSLDLEFHPTRVRVFGRRYYQPIVEINLGA